jgi:hypothetical protein
MLAGAQSADQSATPRVMVTSNIPAPNPSPSPAPPAAPPTVQAPAAVLAAAPATLPAPAPIARPAAPASPTGTNLTTDGLSFSQIKQRLAEARRLMQTRPINTASTESADFLSTIRIAYLDDRTRQIEFVVLTKPAFLKPNILNPLISSSGRTMFLRTIRGNGVNTPVVLTDESGKQHLPLMVQFPRENKGIYTETAYYVSTHPGLVTPEVVNAGRFYVRNTIDVARELLREKGFSIQPRIADMAERLATVEHVDHLRFRTEPHANIYNDIFTLYALNEGQTYRYSVSSAGAGGMVQMIPSTYRIVRAHHPSAALNPDFVEGMRDHVNAAQAMLLYMQMTWNDLVSRPSVVTALATNIATPEQLMAAGYNSNPSRLPGYIIRGGADWAKLIPQETKIYLQIYDSLERHVPLTPRTR